MLTSAVRMRNHHLLFEHLLNIAASPSGAGTGDRVPVASGAAGPHDPSRFRPATDTRGGRACRPGGEGSVSSCPLFQSEPVIGTGRGERISVTVAFDPRIAVIRDPDLGNG